ncbi:MAG: glucose-1-phosphate thymidylyltransferase, partial [Elusimicrobiota bacterium]|nr:glucose-1-phosphate thymidylyltransferase [Elusimicrobiota bacterium]
EDLLEANRVILETFDSKNEGSVDSNSKLEGRVVIEKNATVVNSTVRGPAIIGERTQIVNSYIGPFTSVYFNVIIENSELENSIVLENSKIVNVSRIEGSLIGQSVSIIRTDKKPKAYRIMVGDSSYIEL